MILMKILQEKNIYGHQNLVRFFHCLCALSLYTFLLVDGGDIIELLLLDGGDMRHELLDNDDVDDGVMEPKKVAFHS